jgi:DNA-binding NarL/FixJ family response regulator
MKAIRVVLADDHPVVRAGIRNELVAAGIKVVGEAVNGEDVQELVVRLHPEVVVLDVEMPGLNGLEVARRLNAQQESQLIPHVSILVLSAYDQEAYVFGLLDAGATGYVLKDEALETVVQAVQTVARGEPWLSPRVMAKVIARSSGQPPAGELTEREMDVLGLMAKGLNNLQIAEALSIAERTVRYHVENILSKMKATNRMGAVIIAIQRGLIKP